MNEHSKNRVRMMAEIGMAVALAVVANFMPLWKMPQGGSVSLEMLPILVIAFRWGGVPGILSGFVYGLVQLAVNPYIIHPVQLLLDYPVPYMIVGLAGFIPLQLTDRESWARKRTYLRLLAAVLLGGLGRFAAHLLSGAIFFGQYAPEGQNPWFYSAIYNGSYLLPALLLSYLILIPILKNMPDFHQGGEGSR